MTARIYRPARNAMQSGKAKTRQWILVHEPSVAREVEPLMGYTSSSDMKSQVELSFDTLAEAEAYARNAGLAYQVQPDHQPTTKRVSYPDNFRNDRKAPWTH
ncbi:ETC complex I subunit [Mariluticola halotolerans]|uniref:ETC complex I subunit n=1 Tax=Mariluticola halotolerans TaxID=2909283 RepID=UPI0026E2A2C9|nr:ETC complex I subunit [Mariluticola halotolerans]UJQ95578.1 ETC complex I subunit [Mariluticola halotolerans]